MRALECKKCGRWVDNVGENAKTVTCSYCTMMLVGMPEEPKSTYKPTGRPAGWHWMVEFVDKDGNVFHRGKEQPKLKGTLKPTKVKPPKKKTKRRSKEQILIDRHNEKKAALKKAVKKQKDFLNHQFGK
jgi:hypothetical protein|tara:strand:+ start:1017 stop:1403 length:387 start_codon:yes stop_codon:yes gene_type:complete